MPRGKNTDEYRKVKKSYPDLSNAIAKDIDSVSERLLSEGLITDGQKDAAISGHATAKNRASTVTGLLLSKVEQDTKYFQTIVSVLQQDTVTFGTVLEQMGVTIDDAETSAKPAPSTTSLKMEKVQAPVDQSQYLPIAGTKRKIVSNCGSTESDGNTDNGDHSQHPKRQKLNSVPDHCSDPPDHEPSATHDLTFSSSMSVEDFSKWLRSKGISDKDCKTLSDSGITPSGFLQCDVEDFDDIGLTKIGKKLFLKIFTEVKGQYGDQQPSERDHSHDGAKGHAPQHSDQMDKNNESTINAETSAKPAPSTTSLKMEEVSGSQAPVDQSPYLPTAGTKRKIVSDYSSTASDGKTDNGDHSQHLKKQKLNSVPDRIESGAPHGDPKPAREKPKYTITSDDSAVDPLPKPSESVEALQVFAKDVDIILHTVNDYETQAVLQDLTAPDLQLETQMAGPVNLLPIPNVIILGMFGGYKSALVQTTQGQTCTKEIEDALEMLPKTKAVIAVGVAYASKAKIKYGDVLVSKNIRTVTNPKFHHGTINPRASEFDTVPVTKLLSNTFTRNPISWKNFECSRAGRKANVYTGDVVSVPWLLADQKVRDKLLDNFPDAVGGEMEGHELVKIKKSYKERNPPRDVGVIIIKAAADYGDENKQEGKEWQFTAAKAASSYAKHKLELTQGTLFERPEE